jgi:hypothetical protein
MSTGYLINRDMSGTTNGSSANLAFALDGQSALLAAGTAQSITAPLNNRYWMAVISTQYGKTVYVDGINAAVFPTGAFSSSTAEIVPSNTGLVRYVIAGQTLSFVTDDSGGATVTVKFYAGNLYTNTV